MPGDELGAVAARALDQLTDFAALLDGSGDVVWANDFAWRLLGYANDEILGTSIAQHVHPDDLARALGVLGRMSTDEVALPVTPAFYRLRTREGAWIRVELNATLVARDARGGEADHVAVFGRYSGDHDLQDRIMDLLTTGGRTEDAISLVPEFGLWRHEGIDYAVFFLDDEGEARAAGSPTLLALGGLDDPHTPWARVAANRRRGAGRDRRVGSGVRRRRARREPHARVGCAGARSRCTGRTRWWPSVAMPGAPTPKCTRTPSR